MDTDGDFVSIRRSEWEALLARVDALEDRRPDRDADAVLPGNAGTPPDVSTTDTSGPSVLSRRRALAGLAGATAAGVIAATAGAEPAAADNGQAVVIGAVNTGTAPTPLAVAGDGLDYGLGVVDHGLAAVAYEPAVLGHASGASFNTALLGLAENEADAVRGAANSGFGVYGSSAQYAGVLAATNSTTTAALMVEDNGGAGAVRIQAKRHHIQFLVNTTVIPPDRLTVPGVPGTLAYVSNSDSTGGTLWLCTKSGTPGTWRELAGNASAGSLHVLPAPVRVYDSRPGTLPAVGSKTKLAANTARVLDCTVNSSGVPKGASAVLVTCLLVNATTGNGNFTVWANAVAKPQSNTLVWGGSDGRFTATAVSAVDVDAKVQVQASLATDLVLDVVGYYR